VALAALLLCSTAAAAAQVTASLAAVTAMGSAATLEKKPGCWGCQEMMPTPLCQGGHVPGFWNCSPNWETTCWLSSPGCGAGAALPLDPDGATQFVSRGKVLGLDVALTADGPEYRNCEGAIVARVQAPAQIAVVRHRTATLTL
jgi:hypothetical protein